MYSASSLVFHFYIRSVTIRLTKLFIHSSFIPLNQWHVSAEGETAGTSAPPIQSSHFVCDVTESVTCSVTHSASFLINSHF